MIVYTDGGCTKSNQKDQSIRQMIWVVTDEKGTVLLEKREWCGSNNISEFLGLRDAIRILPENEENIIYTDSMNNLSWLKGKFGKKLNNLKRVEEIFGEILEQNKKFSLLWVPREENKAGWYIEETYSL